MFNEFLKNKQESKKLYPEHQRTIIGIRSDLGMTQEEMASAIGVPLSNYQRYEGYKVKIPLDVMFRIADMVGIVNIREIKSK